MVHAVRNVGHIYVPLSENLSDDLVRVKLRVREKLCLIDLSNFQIRIRIEHYTARIDYNQDLFIFLFKYSELKKFRLSCTVSAPEAYYIADTKRKGTIYNSVLTCSLLVTNLYYIFQLTTFSFRH